MQTQTFKEFLNAENTPYDEETDKKYWGEANLTDDLIEKIRLLKIGAEAGGALCNFELGNRYMTGDGVEKNLEEAMDFLKVAARCGIPGAMLNFGKIVLLATDNTLNP